MVDLSFPAPAALIAHCRPAVRSTLTPKVGLYDKGDVANLIDWLNEHDAFSDYESWFQLGMSLALEFGDAGKDLWARSHDDTVTPDIIETKWESFASEPDSNSITLASFFKRAHDAGWKGTVRPSIGSMFGGVGQLTGSPNIAPMVSKKNYLRTVGDCVRGFVPPDYLIDGILQRRFCYSLTAQTGVGKTTVAMLLAAHVAIGKPLGEIEVERGSVLYFAGENPTDITMRWIGLCREMNLDPETIDVHIIEGTKRFSEEAREITQEIIDAGLSLSLVIVDTSAVYFEGDNDNDNVQAGNHARTLRSLCALPGGPCVLVLCHPTKNATDDNMLPRGGGAFLAELDGNVSLIKNETTITAFALGKFRGPEFTPLNFSLKVVRDHPLLKDSRGRQIPTILAVPISAAEQSRAQERAQTNEEKILEIVCNSPSIRNADIAKAVGWEASRVSRLMPKLEKKKLVEQPLEGRGWVATTKAQRGLNLAATAAARPVQPLAQLTPASSRPGAVPDTTAPRNAVTDAARSGLIR